MSHQDQYPASPNNHQQPANAAENEPDVKPYHGHDGGSKSIIEQLLEKSNGPRFTRVRSSDDTVYDPEQHELNNVEFELSRPPPRADSWPSLSQVNSNPTHDARAQELREWLLLELELMLESLEFDSRSDQLSAQYTELSDQAGRCEKLPELRLVPASPDQEPKSDSPKTTQNLKLD